MNNKESSTPNARVPSPDDIVISGIAGRFPESNNIYELRDNLLEGRDMITQDERRWKLDNPLFPKRGGKVSNLEKFDAVFFGVHPKQAHATEPMARVLLEHSYEAIVDAGINPKKLRGTRTGVFIGTSISESEQALHRIDQDTGFGISGSARALFANRISYALDLLGPSFAIDTACSSSIAAVEQAYRSIHDGYCDAAIVGASHLCLDPYVSSGFSALGALSPDGRCKTWDQSADGYVRSEAVSTIFLQRAKDAKRVYATIVHSKLNNDGYKEEGVSFPSRQMQSSLFEELYKECGVSPSSVSYVEAHGTGTKVGDPEEIAAIDKVFGQSRTKSTPLLIGSVKSNLGHAEPASGLISVAKVVLALETGLLPPNLHFNKCKEDLTAILEGRLKVVTEVTPWKGEYAAINNVGFGGVNTHALLKINPKEKVNNGAPEDDLPRLVAVSGRTEDAVIEILQDLESKPVDVEQLALFYNIHSEEIKGHLYRGYTILPPHGIAKSPIREINYSVSGVKRPVWFVFSGMGSQWPGMGKALLQLPVFAEAIKKCDAALKPTGLDIFRVITDTDPTIFNYIMHSFIGITAVQIGLVDVLTSLGIVPDNIIGHSLGELGCAYADGTLTAEQTIMSAYFRGLLSSQTKFVHGSMVAVGLGYKELQKLCPSDIAVACHNSSTSSTISGPTESVKKFVAELKAKNIFAKEVSCGNIAYHSRYIASVGPKLLELLKNLIPDPKLRSSKWMSTSVPQDKWNTELARYSSAEYHTNNVLSSVLFEETSALIPKDAIAIEIAPHGLLQAILKRSLPAGVVNINLTERGSEDNLVIFLKAIGKLFNFENHPQIAKLYPSVAFPVSRGTPMISPMIKWDHKDDWFVSYFKNEQKLGSGERVVKINIKNPIYETIANHVLDGRIILPATSYLHLIWETFATMKGSPYKELPVVFEDVKFLRATTFTKEEVELTLMIQKGTGRFEVVEGDTAIVTGRVCSAPHSIFEDKKSMSNSNENNEEYIMSTRDVYKEMKLRGYQYAGKFRSISRATKDASKAYISWHDDWVTYIDNMLQLLILGINTRELFVPTAIKKITIDPKFHYAQINGLTSEQAELEVVHDKLHSVLSSGGVQICGVQARSITRRKVIYEPVVEEYKFVPYLDEAETSLRDIAQLATNIAMENCMASQIKTVELLDGTDKMSFAGDSLLSPWISESLGDIPMIQVNTTILRGKKITLDIDNLPKGISIVDLEKASKDESALIVVGHRLLAPDRADHLNLLLHEVNPGGFILTRENEVSDIESVANVKGFHVVLKKRLGKEIFVLLRRKEKEPGEIFVINVRNDNFDWVESMRTTMKQALQNKNTNNARVMFVGQDGFDNGLLGFINCLRREPGGEITRGILIQDPEAPAFSLENPLYSKQIEKDLAVSVLRKNGVWGGYRHLILPPCESKPVDHYFLKQITPGDLSSFTWTEGPLQSNCNNGNLVKIAYASINFRDIMFATGKLFTTADAVENEKYEEAALGIEYSGIDISGKRVMGMISNGAMSNYCIADPGITWEIPDNWSLEDAATASCVYATCCYGLYLKGNMKRGDKVLIHAGTGGIGQAAINLALAEGCEVFTTVSTAEKRAFIRNTFPQIRDDHIGNSRDTSFEHMIREQTNGQGVDIVLNSLSEEKLLASVNCLAWGGRFLEIGKFDLTVNNPLGMECFLREISFHGIMLDHVFTTTELNKLQIKVLLYKYMKMGVIKPLVRKVFSKDDVEAAFRYVAAGNHIGKVLIKIHEDENPSNFKQMAVPQYYCRQNRSYIILGGLGGIGLELCHWLVMRGARNVVLTSRTGFKNGYQKMRVNTWKEHGVNVVVIANKDASVYKDCEFIIESAAKLAPVDAIFNLAAILVDALWENQTAENFEELFKAKANATKNLDSITRKMCPELRHFVVFSSAACGKGNSGQSNYSMSNSVMERICEKRAAEGLPALAIQWGAVGDVGLVANMQENNKELVISGTLQQGIGSCLTKVNEFLLQSRPIVTSMIIAQKKTVGPVNILNCVLNIMALKDLRGINLHSTLSELGMDSMMSIEIKQTLEREFDIFLNPQDVRNLTFAKLQEITDANNSNEKSNESIAVKAETDMFTGMKLLVRFIYNANNVHDTYLKLANEQQTESDEVFAIPGIEGFASDFSGLSSKLKAPITCLQLAVSNFQDTIQDMTDYFITHVSGKCKEKGKFTLIAHSYGSLIAIELARRLEAQGMSGKLFLIDGAPGVLKDIITKELSCSSIEELQSKCLIMMANTVAPQDSLKLSVELEACKDWDEKVEVFAKLDSISKLGLTLKNVKDYCTSIFKRTLAAVNYDVSQLKPIEAPITLIKPTTKSFQTAFEDYGLSKITSSQVEVHYVAGDHVTMLDNDKTAHIVNERI